MLKYNFGLCYDSGNRREKEMEIKNLSTEQRNQATLSIDKASTLEAVQMMNREDQKVPLEISKHAEELAEIIDYIWEKFKEGRLFYCGAGTSGRLAVVDAAECPPTFGVDPGKVVGLIAGGPDAFIDAIEGAEDDTNLCAQYLKEYQFSDKDVLVGIAASGRTPFVIGGLEYAKSIGARTVSISNSKNSAIGQVADKKLEVITGPEALTGSTRLKAGTSQKLILNTITTILFIKFGKVYSNLMVDVQPTNEKLIERSQRIIAESLEVPIKQASLLFEKSDKSIKHAIVMGLLSIEKDEADELLKTNNNRIADILRQQKMEEVR